MVLLPYDNTPMLFTATFNGCKNDNFQIKNCYICPKNIICGYMLEPLIEAVLTSTHDLFFRAKKKEEEK